MRKLCFMLRSAVLFGLLALVWAPAAVAAPETRHIIGVTDVPAALQAIQAAGLSVIGVIPLIDAIVVRGSEEAAKGLANAPFVRYVEADPPDAVWTQEDTLVYGVDNIDAEVVWGGAENATNVIPGKGGAGINVAVIDTGIDCGHPDLSPNCVYGVNYVTPGQIPFDDYGHGTHVAGIVGARDNGVGVIGVAPEAALYAVKVLNSSGSGSWSAVASGIVWATQNGMDVINMSLGGTTFSQAVADLRGGQRGLLQHGALPREAARVDGDRGGGSAGSLGGVLLDRAGSGRGRPRRRHPLHGADRIVHIVRSEWL